MRHFSLAQDHPIVRLKKKRTLDLTGYTCLLPQKGQSGSPLDPFLPAKNSSSRPGISPSYRIIPNPKIKQLVYANVNRFTNKIKFIQEPPVNPRFWLLSDPQVFCE